MAFLILWALCTLGASALMLIGMAIVKRADARADQWLTQQAPEPMPDRSSGRASFEVTGR